MFVAFSQGNSLQHLIFQDFFDPLNTQAADCLESLGPILQNVSRKVVHDEQNPRVSKAAHLALEESDEAISALQGELLAMKAWVDKSKGYGL